MTENSPGKVPIVGPSWVDDMIMSQAIYRAIKEIIPLTKISHLARSALRPLLEQIPEVAEMLKSDFEHGDLRFNKKKRVRINLRDGNFNRAFILPLADSKKLITTGIECQPFYKKERLFGHLRWLTEMQPERVLDAITSFGQDVK